MRADKRSIGNSALEQVCPFFDLAELPAGSIQKKDGVPIVLPPEMAVLLGIVAKHAGQTPVSMIGNLICDYAKSIGGQQELADDCGLSKGGER